MSRVMGDAIHDNVAALRAAPIQMAAGYVTGTVDVKWTQADWNQFLEIPRVTIDQGYQSPPVTTATVRDVEPKAWTVAAAVDKSGWTAQRPTIYCDQYDLERPGGVLSSGWRGDLWIAIPGWKEGQPLPSTPGCTVVAVQNQLGVGNTHDLSVVLDPAWPSREAPPMGLASYQPGSVGLVYTPAGQLQIYGVGQDDVLYVSDVNPDLSASNTRAVTNQLTFT